MSEQGPNENRRDGSPARAEAEIGRVDPGVMSQLERPRVEDTTATDPHLGAREAMVRTQLMVPGRDIRDPRVLTALRNVPRHEFIPADLREYAYEDRPLPIGYGQTISQPFIVGFMTECLELRSSDRVLEVGTGCGYQTAVLSLLAARICTVEILQVLAERARFDLGRLGYANIDYRCGDGWFGWSSVEPGMAGGVCEGEFDAILVSCAPTRLPAALAAQLKEGGRLVVPIGARGDQTLRRFRKMDGRLNQESLFPVRFVPMTGTSR